MSGPPEVELVMAAQRAWAERTGRALAPGGRTLANLEDAIPFGALDERSRAEFAAGAGGELRRLTSLRSSSALALNVFGPWRDSPEPLARALGAVGGGHGLRFEAVYPTGLRGVPPHLDVVMDGPAGIVAVESKFLELYSPAVNTFRPSYVSSPTVWTDLPACRRLMEQIIDGSEVFARLGASQLLKHALGLSRARRPFRLVLVWFRVEGPAAREIDLEITRFADAVADDLDFQALSYQELRAILGTLPEPVPGYLAELDDRYFGRP